ncbi:MAG: MFS transporter [Nitrospinota bacterium]|nr:MFS transporter [Nitrospinota bacterium]
MIPSPPATENSLSSFTIFRILVPFSFGYFFSFLFRSINAVIAPDLVRDVGASAADLGLITSVYFFSFALFQIPLGILLDRYGPRIVAPIILLIAALGSFIFAAGGSVSTLVAGRVLIGLGCSAALMSAFMANVLWFPKKSLGLANGVLMTVGGLGALAATAPAEIFLRAASWRTMFILLGAVTALVAGLTYLAVPSRAPARRGESARAQWRGVAAILKSPVFWRYAPTCSLTSAMSLGLQGLWAAPWLRDVAGLNPEAVARHLFVIAVFMVAGYALMGLIIDTMRRFRVGHRLVTGMGLLLFLAVQLMISLGYTESTYILWASFGFLGTINTPYYAIMTTLFPAHMAGRVNTTLNLTYLLGIMIAQYAIGIVIDFWPVTAGGGYDPAAYSAAFGLFLGLQAIALVWFLWPRREEETISRFRNT